MIIRGNTITVQKPSLALKGGTMTGTLDMNENILKGIPTPTEKDHAVNKEYADFKAANALKDAKKYVDGTDLTATLQASAWSGSSAPYTQTVSVAGILEEDDPDYWPVYSGSNETRIAQKGAFAVLDLLTTANGSITVTCFEEKPDVDLTIGMEVHR